MRLARMLLMGSSLVVSMNFAKAIPAAAPVKLNGDLVFGGNVDSARFSADGSRVVYVADQDTDNLPELYSVPISGGTSVKLNGSLDSGGSLSHFVLPSDPVASHLLYLADQETPLVEEVYSVPIAGGTPVKLNGPLAINGDVSVMQISGDGTHAFYRADQITDNVLELYQVPATGGTPVKINGPLVAGGDVSDLGLQFSPDGSWILYHADQNFDGTFEIFSVPTTGGTPVRLNATLPVNGDVSTNGLQFSPDGSRVMYVADQEVDNVLELYTVPSGGGTPVKLNGALVSGGDVLANRVSFSPDGSNVLYVADQQTDGVLELFIVPSTGGTSMKLNGPLPPLADVDISSGSLHFTSDGSRVVYLADQEIDAVTELYSVLSTGGTTTKLNSSLVPGGDVYWAMPSPDGSRVVYRADQDTDNVYELYSVPIEGGPSAKLNAPLAGGGEVYHFSVQFTPDGSRVLYSADPLGSTPPETYIVPASGGTAIKLSARVALGDGYGEWPLLSPDGSQVIYRADPDMDGAYELYARVVAQQWVGGSDAWDSPANWNHSALPDEAMLVVIDEPVVVTLPASLEDATVNEIRLGGGAGPSTLQLESDATLTAINGVTIESNGVLQGDGHILGSVIIANGGRLSPGTSAGALEVADIVMTADSLLDIEIGGPEAGDDFDQLIVDGMATLDGTIDVTLSGEYLPDPAQEFIVLTAAEILDSGTVLAGPAAGLFDLTVADTFVSLRFLGGLPGDYNGDLVVDAADYTVWRDAMEGGGSLLNDMSPDDVDETDYEVWRQHFSQSLNSGGGAANAAVPAAFRSAVPEPSAIELTVLAWMTLLIGNGYRSSVVARE